MCDLKTGVTPPELILSHCKRRAYMHGIPNKRLKKLGFYVDLGDGQKVVEAALL